MFEGVCAATVAGVQTADPFALAAALAPLTQQQLSHLTLDEAECVVAATQRVINAFSARQAVAVETFADRAEAAFRQEEADYAARWRALAAEDGDEDWRPTPALTHRPRPEQVAGAMLAPILRLAPRTMVSRIHAARSLAYLPRTFALAWAGDLEPHRAAIVTRVVERVAIDDWTEFEARLHHSNVVPLTGTQLKARALKVAFRLEQQDGHMNHAQRDRWVRIEPNDSPGSTKWTAQLPADRSQQMWAAIDQLAGKYIRANPALTVEQARADAMTDLLLTDVQVATAVQIVVPADSGVVADGGVAPAEPDSVPDPWVDSCTRRREAEAPVPTPGEETGSGRAASHCETVAEAWRACRRRLDLRHPMFQVAITEIEHAESLLFDASPLESRVGGSVSYLGRIDLNPHLARDATGNRVWFVPHPVSVPGIGCLLPEQLNRLLSDPDISVGLARAHPGTGAVDTADPHVYRPGKQLAREVRARDGTCRFPGCATTAERCHLDHVIPHPEGPTTKANLQSLCVAHHGFKHHAGWTVTMTPDGICTWTAPNGRAHATHPRAIHDDAA